MSSDLKKKKICIIGAGAAGKKKKNIKSLILKILKNFF